MSDFLQLQEMQPHEAVLELLTQPSEFMTMHFISHEWLSFHHPDPWSTQLAVMQGIFDTFAAGKARSMFKAPDWEAFLGGFSTGTAANLRAVEQGILTRDTYEEEHIPEHVSSGCVWLDYHSIPQDLSKQAFLDAVRSIPHYVERCNYFWVCAPPAYHRDLDAVRDFTTWRGRGWCRFEETANLLSKTLKMPLLVTGEHMLSTYGWMDAMHWLVGHEDRSVGNGQFTCCRFDHKMKMRDGSEKTIKCDKEAIGPVLADMYVNLYEHLTTSDDAKNIVFKRGVLRTVAPVLFAGMEQPLKNRRDLGLLVSNEQNLDDFMDYAGFDDIDDVDGLGWPVLLQALMYGSMSVVKEIVEQRPDMLFTRTKIGATVLPYGVVRPLAEFREVLSWDPRSTSLEQLNYCSPSGYTAVDKAAKNGFHENLRYLLELGAYTEPRRKDNGATPLLSACEEGYPLCVEVLLEFRADIGAVDHMRRSALHLAAHPLAILGNPVQDAKLHVVEALLKAKASTNCVDSQGRTPLQVATALGFESAGFVMQVQTQCCTLP